MNGGEISGNSISDGIGGGVNASGGPTRPSFTMNGGEISGNTVDSNGGGEYAPNGTFTKQSGGIIYGSNANSARKNKCGSDF